VPIRAEAGALADGVEDIVDAGEPGVNGEMQGVFDKIKLHAKKGRIE
jgi:hypothetical protein